MIVNVTVVPNSGFFKISQKDGKTRIYLKSKAEDNKANIELIKKLKKLLKCEVRLVSGMKSKTKKLELSIPEQQWEDFIAEMNQE